MLWLLSVILLASLTSGAREADLITDLPGLNYPINFQQYSGYLQASDTQFLHYWFVESQNDPLNDPVVLWLNGGPGCSSMYGLLVEHGPFLINDDGTELVNNPYSWNLVANMIYLESPAGVGYSYSTGKISTSDDDSANQNYNAIKQFFDAFPEFNPNQFFIAGESYAGIYVPTLSEAIVSGNQDYPINFQGFTVGNPIADYSMNDDSIVYFTYYHGLFGDEMWNNMTTHCCIGDATKPENCYFDNPPNAVCQAEIVRVSNIVWNSGLNTYALYRDCLTGSTRQMYEKDMSHIMRFLGDKHFEAMKNNPLAGSTRSTAPCLDDDGEVIWLNNPDVKTALHISPEVTSAWTMCANIPYLSTYDTMADQYNFILSHSGNYRVLMYNGDTDMACNFLGDQWFVNSLNRKVLERRKEWFYNNQVAGFVEVYDGITYTTVKGVGHMVPQWAPAIGLQIFENFLFDLPFNT